ncbi:MAG TPA: ATP-binding protein [Thermoanaerobaculia bacterium]|nr:ATP-binding protein [Thermoanaerobaculia bacterium]
MADDVAAYEKLGAFYLGRPWDPARGATAPAPLLYDSRDLLTHAVCVGMTGSGKTGLLIGLLEEAAIDHIPALVIDPKGDLSNLLLTFPELRPADFAPWVDPDAAARAGVSPEAYAAQQAEAWKAGLASWDQTGERIARLREAADFAIYTPGSEAGLQVSILSSLDAPPPEVVADGDALRERIATVVSSLLSLLEVESDPIQGREHILLASIFDAAWRQGQGLDLAALIQQIQRPPVERVGVMDLETFYPAKERFGLSLALNNLLGSPGFAAWLRGEPLDVDRLLYTPSGKPRIAIFSIAHLADKERMFFTALLFNQTLGWMRSKPGTTSLRALLCMDEVFGYMPPVAEPPSKRPLLTLLKQARAFGLGLVLATQNPVDLDYKGLSNVGTWFLGRLQTERDKQRLMDGLEGAAGGGFDRAKTEQVLSGLASRVFLLHNVHEDQPVLFQTRWTLSYLRGPLTRPEIKRLMDPRKQGAPAVDSREVTSTAVTASTTPAAAPSGAPKAEDAGETAPVLPPDVQQRFLPVRGKPVGITYLPCLFAAATVHYQDAKLGVEHAEELSLLGTLTDDGADWYAAEAVDLGKDDLEGEAVAGARFSALPDAAVKAKSYDAWRKALEECLYRTRKCELFRSATLGEVSKPGEPERDFRIRLTETAREARDEQVAALRKKYGVKIATLQERVRRAEQAREKQKEQANQQTLQTVVSAGAAVLGMFFGRRRSPITAAATAARGVGRTFQERQDVGRAEETIEALQKQLADLNAELEHEVDNLGERFDPQAGELEVLGLKPRKTDVETRFLCLAWEPRRGAEVGWR